MSVVKKAALKDRANALQSAYVAEVKAAAAAQGKKVCSSYVCWTDRRY